MGWMDEEGYVYLADRRTDLILRGGANIYPAEVEAALDAHPDVGSSVVIGLPDVEMGQRVMRLYSPNRMPLGDWMWRTFSGSSRIGSLDTKYPKAMNSRMAICATMLARCGARHCAMSAPYGFAKDDYFASRSPIPAGRTSP